MEVTKKKYHYPADLKQDLLEKGIAIIQDKGIDGLTLKSLATSLGVTSAAMYHHYPDKTALLVAIVQKHLDELKVLLDEKTYTSLRGDAEQLLLKSALVFFNFCEEHPDFLPLASGDIVKSWTTVPAIQERLDYLFSVPLAVIKEGQSKGQFTKGSPEVLLGMFFSPIYGFSSVLFNKKISLSAGIAPEGRKAFIQIACASLSLIKGNDSLKNDAKQWEHLFK